MKVFAIISAIIAGFMFVIFWAVAQVMFSKGQKNTSRGGAVLMVLMGIWLMTAICLACIA